MELQNYELVLIINPEVEDEKLGSILERLGQTVTAKGGTVVGVEQWGKRRFTYPIKRFTEGTYVMVKLGLASSSVLELEVGLRLSQDVIRHLLVRVDSKGVPVPSAVVEEGGKGVAEHGEPE